MQLRVQRRYGNKREKNKAFDVKTIKHVISDNYTTSIAII